MNINRLNYEEFLLLYIDGELSSTQQKEVEFFLEQHTDILQEFNDLLDTKLQVDEISFGDVSTLLKKENDSINLNNYQEHFLLFVDNELSKEQKQLTETFVLQHPALQNEFTMLQQTKLPIETIECPNKEELYKKERKPIVFYLQRIAVAAVFIGFAMFVWNLVNTNKKQEVVKNIPNKIDSKIVSPTIKNESINKDVVIEKSETVSNTIVPQNKKTTVVVMPLKQEKSIVKTNVPNEAKQQPVQQNIQQQNSNIVSTNVVTNNPIIAVVNKPEVVSPKPKIEEQKMAAAIATTNVEENRQNENSGKSITILNAKIKQSKGFKFFKKAAKFLTTKSEETETPEKFSVAISL